MREIVNQLWLFWHGQHTRQLQHNTSSGNRRWECMTCGADRWRHKIR